MTTDTQWARYATTDLQGSAGVSLDDYDDGGRVDFGWHPATHDGAWDLAAADAHLASLGLRRVGEWREQSEKFVCRVDAVGTQTAIHNVVRRGGKLIGDLYVGDRKQDFEGVEVLIELVRDNDTDAYVINSPESLFKTCTVRDRLQAVVVYLNEVSRARYDHEGDEARALEGYFNGLLNRTRWEMGEWA